MAETLPAPQLARTIAGSIAAQLRAEITSGQIPAGEKLRQNELAKRFGVSSTPVREAIAQLRIEGLVSFEPQRGATVFKPSVAQVREQYLIRIELEALAIRQAAGVFTPHDAPALEAILAELAVCADPARTVELNNQFHTGLYELSGMHQLSALINNLRASSSAYLQIYASTNSASPRIAKEHQNILDACKNNDPEAADQAIRSHLGASLEHITAALDAAGQ